MPERSIDEAAYRMFKERTFGNGYMIWHDGLDTGAVTRLRGEAREEALAMLRFGLSIGDEHAAQALAAMGDDASRETMLAELAATHDGSEVSIALAAHALNPDPSLASYLVRVLRGPLHWGVRIDAAIGLRHFAGDEDERALLDAVSLDPDYLVRYHACESLLARWGVTPREITGHASIFKRIATPSEGAPTTEHFAGYGEARAAMEALRTKQRR